MLFSFVAVWCRFLFRLRMKKEKAPGHRRMAVAEDLLRGLVFLLPMEAGTVEDAASEEFLILVSGDVLE